MAGLMSKSIREDFLTCQICFEDYTDPKVLACMHSFCCHCVRQTFEKAPRAKDVPERSLPCPICRTLTVIPDDGVEQLRTNFLLLGLEEVMKNEKACTEEKQVNCEYCLEDDIETVAFGKCVDCDEFLCERCAKAHSRAKATREHEIIILAELNSEKGKKIARSKRRVCCAVHPKEQVNFYCQTCEKAICAMSCRMLEHIQHDCIQLEDAAKTFESEVQDDLRALKTKVSAFEKAIQETEDLRKASNDHAQSLKTKIQKQANQLHDFIKREEAKLIQEVDAAFDQSEKELEHAKEGLNVSKASVSSTIDFTEHLINYGNAAEVASMKAQTVERLQHLRSVQPTNPPALKKLSFIPGSDSANNMTKAFGALSSADAIKTAFQAVRFGSASPHAVPPPPPKKSQTKTLLETMNVLASKSDQDNNNRLMESLKAKDIIKSDKVLTTMKSVVRGHYSPNNPYIEKPQSIGYGATISAPHMHAHTLELIKDYIKEGSRCLDVGMGSGYFTACMAVMAGKSGFTAGIDIEEGLVKVAEDNMRKDQRLAELLDKNQIILVSGDGKKGHQLSSPFDVIHVGGSAPQVPQELINQLRPGGALVMPIGDANKGQSLKVVTKKQDGSTVSNNAMGVIYQQLK